MYANLRLGWFEEFQRYWVSELGNRPLHPHDFYHLYGVYRQRLQSIEPDLSSDASQLESWRDHRIVYYLFSHAYRQALSPLRVQRYARFIPRHGRIAEYGCGTAPIVTALARHYRHLDLALVAADIPHLLFHFMRWRFRDVPYVTPVAINPDDDAALPGPYDVIFCLETFEHLPRPLAALTHFHTVLRPGGVLVLDYIRSEATYLDTPAALRDREPRWRSCGAFRGGGRRHQDRRQPPGADRGAQARLKYRAPAGFAAATSSGRRRAAGADPLDLVEDALAAARVVEAEELLDVAAPRGRIDAEVFQP